MHVICVNIGAFAWTLHVDKVPDIPAKAWAILLLSALWPRSKYKNECRMSWWRQGGFSESTLILRVCCLCFELHRRYKNCPNLHLTHPYFIHIFTYIPYARSILASEEKNTSLIFQNLLRCRSWNWSVPPNPIENGHPTHPPRRTTACLQWTLRSLHWSCETEDRAVGWHVEQMHQTHQNYTESMISLAKDL